MSGWSPVYVDGVPVEMRWDETPHRVERSCPKTWPHEAHEPWFDGEIRPIGDAVSFSCPGVPVEGR